MNRKFIRKLQRSFEKRGGAFGVSPDASKENIVAMLEGLLDCPDCRAAVLEACNADDRNDIDIDNVIRELTLSRDH